MGVLLLGIAVAALLAGAQLAIQTGFFSSAGDRLAQATRPRVPSPRGLVPVRADARKRPSRASQT